MKWSMYLLCFTSILQESDLKECKKNEQIENKPLPVHYDIEDDPECICQVLM